MKVKSKLNSLCLRVNSRFLNTRVLGLPRYIQVETTNRCNLKCRMCPNNSPGFHKNKVLRDLSVDEFRHIAQSFPFLKDIHLQGLGEPIMNKDLPEIIGLCSAKSIKTSFVTNGLLLTPELSERLIRAGLDNLTVSVDAGSEDSFQTIRGGNLARLLGNLKGFVEAKNRLNSSTPNIRIMTVGMKSNRDEIPAIVEIAAEAGVSNVTVKGLNAGFDKDLEKDRLDEQDRAVLMEMKNKAALSGVCLDVAVTDDAERKMRCRWPWTRAYITASGDVTPCCNIIDGEYSRLGNIFEQDFASIWNARRYMEFRDRLKNGTAVPCKGCPDY